MDERPAFHEIRALAAHLFEQQGIDHHGRMAHGDSKSTKIYTRNHKYKQKNLMRRLSTYQLWITVIIILFF